MFRLLYLIGRPIYFVLETAIILLLVLLYQTGQFITQRLPALFSNIGLVAKFLTLKIPNVFKKQFHIPKLKLPPLPALPSLPKLGLKRKVILLFSLLVLGGLSIAFLFWFTILRDLPHPEDLVSHPRPLTTHIYDRAGNLLFKIYRSKNRTYIPLHDIPLTVQQATIAIEDAEFYSHPGFSLRGILRAIGQNITRRELTGGSTITQQLVKNALLTPEKTLRRKIKEIILSFWVEATFTKDQILEMYLNEVSYGGTAYGVEEAAQTYFGKHANQLSLSQAALLAGLTAAPTHYSPFGANPELARVRQQLVLARMTEEGFITPQEGKLANEEPLNFRSATTDIKAAHFVMWVKQLLVEEFGQRQVEEGGLEVTTSLSLPIQEEAEKVVKDEVTKLAHLRVSNGAAIVTNPKTGEILAMVGSVDYFRKNWGSFNVTTAPRQPGSSIKPVNYSFALGNGMNPATMIDDSPITYNTAGSPPYTPRNYDNTFRGNVPLRIALGSSLNVPAVKVLASYGVPKMIEQGQKMGITTWDQPSRFGLSLTLGGGEVKMTDMAVVYGTLANYGQKVTLNPILKVVDNKGKVLRENNCNKNSLFTNHYSLVTKISAAVADPPCDGEKVLDPRVAFLLTDILHDNNARIPAFGPNSLLVIPDHNEVAVKTGTTQNLRDNWAIGYTKDYVVATWVGNNDNTPMSYVASGVTGATPIWHNIMQFLLQDQPNHDWEVPEGVVKIQVCQFTGSLPCVGCPVREEWFLEENQPKNSCDFRPVIEEIQQETGREDLPEEEKRTKILEKLNSRNKRD